MSSRECPACGSGDIETLEGTPDPVCAECGLVINENVEVPPVPESQSDTHQEYKQWSDFVSVTNATEKQIAKGLDYLIQFSNELSLSVDSISSATEIFAEAAVEDLADGRSWKLIGAAAVCLGARKESEPRATGSIAEVAQVDANQLRKVIRLVQNTLTQEWTTSPPEEYVDHLCDELGLADEAKNRGEILARKYSEEFRVSGKNPVGIAAAAVYEGAEEYTTQREVAETAGITQETIRVRLNGVREVDGENYD